MNQAPLILVVDDDETNRFCTVQVLRSAGYGICEAATGAAGLELMLRRQPDLALLDVHLPDLDGRDLCQRIKNDPALANTFVVMYSASQIDSTAQAEGLLKGADGYIAQPVANQELLARVAAMVRLQQNERSLRQRTGELLAANRELETAQQVLRETTERALEARCIAERMVAELQHEVRERQRVEQALRESEERFRLVVENVSDVIWVLDLERRTFRYVSPSVERLRGYTAEEVMRMDLGQALTPASLAYLEKVMPGRLAEFLRGNRQVYRDEIEQTRRDGTTVWTETSTRYQTLDGGGTGVYGVSRDISERQRMETELRQSVAEKTALLKEIHHRVKNNLQIMTSLINLQAGRITHPEALAALADTKARLRSMSLLHETLYQSGRMDRVSVPEYLQHLCAHLARSLGAAERRIHIVAQAAPLSLEVDQAVPCGLIINELVANACKHAFPQGRAGVVEVQVTRLPAGGKAMLRVADDGVGIPENLDIQRTETLGFQLVSGLTRQLQGELCVRRQNGTVVEIFFLPGGQNQ